MTNTRIKPESPNQTSSLPTLQDGPLLLRQPRPSDIQDRLAVGYNRDYVRFVGGEIPETEPEYGEKNATDWVRKVASDEHGWIIDVDDRCVGQACLHSFRPAERRARFAIGIFDPAYWSRGVGLTVARLVVGYGFGQIKLHRIDLRVLAFNARAIAMYEKAGFTVEGVERDSAWINGRWESDVWMSILEGEYRHDQQTS